MAQDTMESTPNTVYSGRRPFFKSLVYGRTILNALLIILQLFILALFFVRVIPAAFLAGAQYFLAVAFLIYLANSRGRNEYKLSWLVPVLVFPVFGIVCYILVHKQGVPKSVKRRLAMLSMSGRAANPLSVPLAPTRNPYPKADGISNYLWQAGHHALFTNCDVAYYPSGEAAFPVMLERIRGAKSFIFIEFFLIKKGWMWARLLEAITQRAQAGVEVRLLFDALGSITLPAKKTVKDLTAKGIKARAFAPMVPFFSPYLNNRDHRKIIVIDGEAAFTGGINIGDEYIGRDNSLGKWKDNAVLVRGAAVSSFTQMFLNLWNAVDDKSAPQGANYFSEKARTFVSPGIIIPYCDDAYNGLDIAENVYLYVINNAKKSIHITTPYVALDNRLLEALLFAAKSAVDVQIIVPRSIDHYLTYCIGRTYLSSLTAGGVKVYEYSPGFIHAKTIVADGESAVVGTINFDYRSLFAQFEDAVFIHKGNAILEMENDFKRTLDECVLLSTTAYKKRPLIQRILGFIGRLFAPLV